MIFFHGNLTSLNCYKHLATAAMNSFDFAVPVFHVFICNLVDRIMAMHLSTELPATVVAVCTVWYVVAVWKVGSCSVEYKNGLTQLSLNEVCCGLLIFISVYSSLS